MSFAHDNTIPKAKSFSKAKEAFLNALEHAKCCSRRFKEKCSRQPDKHDNMLLDFIETFASSLPTSAEEISRTREKIISRRGWKDILIPQADIPATAAPAESSKLFPASFLNTTASALSPSSSPVSISTTLTPQAPTVARPVIPDAIEVVVETSTTGQGEHKIWRYSGDKARAQAAPITPEVAPVYTSWPGVIVKPSATGLGTHTVWLDTTDSAPGQTVSTVSQETSSTPKPTLELSNLSPDFVTPSKRLVVMRDHRPWSPSSNGSSPNSGLTRSEKSRARYRSPTPYPVASRPAPPPPSGKQRLAKAPESQNSNKRSRDIDDDEEEATRPTTRTRSSQESLVSNSPSVTGSDTPVSTRGSPSPSSRRSEHHERPSKKGKGKETLKDN